MKSLLRLSCAFFVSLIVIETSVSAKDEVPVVVSQVKPVYPPDLRRQGVEGEVVVEFIIDTKGRVAEASVSPASESAPWQFKYAAVVSVWQWTFKPGLKDDVPVNVRMAVPINFDISG